MNEYRCRACAVSQERFEKMISLLEKDLSEMFTNCTSLKITADDNLPSRVCFECYKDLKNVNKFRQKCLKSDTLLREQITTEEIKVEPVEPFFEIVIKYEEPEQQRDLKLEFPQTESIDDVLSQCDPDTIAHDPVTTAEQSNLFSFDCKIYICDYCGLQFDRKNQITSHMRKHVNETVATQAFRPANFVCTVEGCEKAFALRKSFNYHRLKVHQIKKEVRVKVSPVKKLRLSCEHCPKPKWFLAQHKLDAHIRVKHKGLKAYMCLHCDKGFGRHHYYLNHLASEHNAVDNIKFHCSYEGCDRKYSVSDSLKVHIKRVHLGQIKPSNTKLVCDQCGLSFSDTYRLKQHSYTHGIGVMPWACKICPRKFPTRYNLKIHTMRHLKIKPFVCPTCGAQKTTNKELQAHLNFHSKEKSYPCKECPRVFTSYGAHCRHVRIHHRNHKPYICPHCQRAFTKAETMKNHIMTHTGEKPFACSVCGHRFIQSVALKTHMKVHNKK